MQVPYHLSALLLEHMLDPLRQWALKLDGSVMTQKGKPLLESKI